MKFKYLVHIFIFGLVFTLVSCDAKKSSTNTLSTIAAYSGTIDVSVVNESATVSWQAQSGDSYKIYYSGSADPNASGWTLATTSPVTASPATISIGSTGNNQTIYFRITRVSGSGESAKSSAYVYATLPASFVFDSSKLRMSGGTVYVSSSINSLATTWELYRLPSGTSPRVDWIKVA
ncbi:MAG: hypothetical protein OEW08_04065, partial [Gammaproteobacteria bacterium]|nr:hypothetical protein [Gammaproteobacteria bacterium]